MKILIDNYSGHITLQRMLPHLIRKGHKIVKNINDKPDVYLSNVHIQKNNIKPVVLRLDSIYYDSDKNYKEMNSNIKKYYSIANGIILQSEYSRKLIKNIIGLHHKDAKRAVIYNGIEKNWCGEFEEHDGINITVTGKHRRHKRLKEIVDLFLEYNKIYNNSFLHIFGLLHDNKTIKHKNIKYYGHIDRKEMYNVLRITDFTLHLSKRDSCPNSVVEYIGAGIPVITTNNCGGATEMCQITDGCIIVDGDGDYNTFNPVPHYRDSWNVFTSQVKNDIIKAMIEMTKNKRRVVLPNVLSAEYMTDRYLEMMVDLV